MILYPYRDFSITFSATDSVYGTKNFILQLNVQFIESAVKICLVSSLVVKIYAYWLISALVAMCKNINYKNVRTAE